MTCNAHGEEACIVCDFPAWEAKAAAELAILLEDLRRFDEVELPAMLASGGLTQ
jgi:hypothetical protein